MSNRLEHEPPDAPVRLWQIEARQSETPRATFACETCLATLRQTLMGLTEAEKDAVVDEARQHLLASARSREELGETPEQAMQNAVATFGVPHAVGQDMAATYEATSAKRGLPLAAMRRAAQVIVPANLITSLVFGLDIWCEYKNYYQFLFAQEVLGKWVLLLLLGLMLPVWLGWKIGSTASVRRAGPGTFLTLLAFALAASAVAFAASWVANQVAETLVVGTLFWYPAMFAMYWIFVSPIAAFAAERVRRRNEPRLQRAR